MNDFLKRVSVSIKKPKTLVVLGVVGIMLIFLSSFLPSGEKKEGSKGQTFDAESYRLELQKEIAEIVESITGDNDSTVVITLESGVRYTYADVNEEDNSSSAGEKLEESSSSSTKSYITVKTADGGEQPLLVAEIMPKVRGVAVVCAGGDDGETAEKITKAVSAALDITAKRVYIAGGKVYEKR